MVQSVKDVTSCDAPWVLAHRGASRAAPQNSLAAVRLASSLGADGLEVDLQRCRTGEVVVFHDFDLGGFGVERRVARLSLAELRGFDLGGGERIPTLDELLDAADPALILNLELKHHGVRGDGLEDAVASVIARHPTGVRERLWFSSFNPFSLWRIRGRLPGVGLGFLFHGEQSRLWRAAWPRVLRWVLRGPGAPLGLAALHPQHRLVDEALMTAARARGLRVHPWTVDRPADLARVLALGVDAVITNDPAGARAMVERAAARVRIP